MITVKAVGKLRHAFHGEYFAALGLEFSTEQHAHLALKTLGPDWKLGQKQPKALIWVGGGDKLSELKERLKGFGITIRPCGMKRCRGQCKKAEIDSLAHSIDYGPWFEVQIPVEDPNQATLLGGM